MEQESKSGAREHADFYLRGREVSTIAIYNAECKELVEYCGEVGELLFGFGERDVVDYIIYGPSRGSPSCS